MKGINRIACNQISSSWYMYLLLFIGVSVFGIGVGSIFFLDNLVRSKLADGLVLRPASESFKQWIDPPADIFFEIYLMNVTNPAEAAMGIAKPRLADQGPYVFREIRKKNNVTFHRDKTLTFSEPISYIFDPIRSVGPLSDKVTQLDLVVAGMSHKFSRCYGGTDCLIRNSVEKILPSFGFDVVNELFKVYKRSIFKTYTVGDLLWGHKDPFLEKMSEFAAITGEEPRESVGLFEGKNGTSNGWYTIFSGEGNISAYQEVISYKDMKKMTAWSTPYANMLNGSVGHGFRPFLKPTDNLVIFAGDLCRSSELVYDKTVMIGGVETFQYKPPRWSSIPYPRNPDQEGFCTPDTTDCPPEGVLNETACIGQPILMAKPHFLHADPRLGEAFEGLKADDINHETFLHIDPLTGSILSAKKRLMMLFPFRESFLSKAGNIRLAPNMDDGTTAFPLFWVNETAMVHDSVLHQIRNLAYPAMAAARIIPHLLVATGIAITVVSAGLLLWGFCRQAQRQSVKYEFGDVRKAPVASSKSPVQMIATPADQLNAKFINRPPSSSSNAEVIYQKTQVHKANQTGHSRNPSSASSIAPVLETKVPNLSQDAAPVEPLLVQRSTNAEKG